MQNLVNILKSSLCPYLFLFFIKFSFLLFANACPYSGLWLLSRNTDNIWDLDKDYFPPLIRAPEYCETR
ncbi:hypothetical protein BLOT_005996 [Blomia tropicalis]|nr:hypothetical protein BLOT_005996 [Blomia tropicalis]